MGAGCLYLASPLARYASSAGILMHGGGENPPAWARRVHRSNFAGFTSDYVQRVDSSGEFECRMRHQGVVVAVNSMGLNDREVDEAAPHYRVLVLGDSLTLAAGVEQADLYHSLVEAQYARDLGISEFVEFYNAGREGRTLARELRDLEQALSMQVSPPPRLRSGVPHSSSGRVRRHPAEIRLAPSDRYIRRRRSS